MRLLHVAAALLLLAVALCRAEEETTDEVTEVTEEVIVETTTMSLRNRLRPRLRLQTTAAPTASSNDGELQTQEGGSTAASAATAAPTTVTPKPKRNRNRNRNRKATTPAVPSADDDNDGAKSKTSTTRRPNSRSKSRNRNRSSSSTKAPTERSTSRSSKRRGSGRKSTSTTQASDNVDVTTPKPSRGRKTIAPRRPRPTPRRKSSTTPTPSTTTTLASETKTTKRSRPRAGLNARTTKNVAKTTTPTISTTTTTKIPLTTTPTRPTPITGAPPTLPDLAFTPLQDKEGTVRSPPKTALFAEPGKIHHKPAFASDSVFLNSGVEDEPVRGVGGGFQGVPPKVVGPVTFSAGRRQFRPRPEEGIILDAQEKPVDKIPPHKEQMGQGVKPVGIPLRVIDPVIGGAGRDTHPVASHAQGTILEEPRKPLFPSKAQSTSVPPGNSGTSALPSLPPNEKPVTAGARPLVPFQPNAPRRELPASRLKPDGFNEENMEVVPEKDPSRFEEPIGVPPKPVGPLSIRPLSKKIIDNAQSDSINSGFAPGERVFIPPPEDRNERTTPRSLSVPVKTSNNIPQHASGNRDATDSRFTLRTDAPARSNLVSSSPSAFNDRRNSHRLTVDEVPLHNKVSHRGSVTTPLPPRRYSDVNSVRQKTRVTESPAASRHENEDVSGVQVKARPNNVTPFPLWIDPRLTNEREQPATSGPKDNRAPSRPVASKRVTIPVPIEEDEPHTSVKSRVPSRPQQRVTFAPNPVRRTEPSTSIGTTTTTQKTTPLTSSFRPRFSTHPSKQHGTTQTPSTTLDDASGEDFSEEDEDVEERVTFPPRRNAANLETSETLSSTRFTPSPLATRPNTAQGAQSPNRLPPAQQNSFASQQFESTPRRANFHTARAVGTNMPLEQDVAVSSSIPKGSSVLSQLPQAELRNTNRGMAKDMMKDTDMMMKGKDVTMQDKDMMMQDRDMMMGNKDMMTQDKDMMTQDKDMMMRDKDMMMRDKDMMMRDKDMMMKDKDMMMKDEDMMMNGKPMSTPSPPSEFISTEDTDDDDEIEPLELAPFNHQSPAGKTHDERLPRVQVTTENTRNTQGNTRLKGEVPLANSRSSLVPTDPFAVPAQSRFVSLENEPSSMPARGRNSFPIESTSTPILNAMQKSKSPSAQAVSTPQRQQNSDSFSRTAAMHTTPLDSVSGRQRVTIPPAATSTTVAPRRSAPESQSKLPMQKEVMPLRPEWEDVDPEYPDDDAIPPQPAGRLMTPSVASNPQRLAGTSDLSKTSQFFESPSFIIRKPVGTGATREQVQLVPEVPEVVPVARNPAVVKAEAQEEGTTVARGQPMVKPEVQEAMPKTRNLTPLMTTEVDDFMPSVPSHSTAKDSMTNMKDMPLADSEDVSRASPAQQRSSVPELLVTSPQTMTDSRDTQTFQPQATTSAVANPEEGVDYEYYYA